jgi:hypothetical protein
MLKSLGIDYRSVKPKKSRAKVKPTPGASYQETEAMLFFHLPNNKIVMRWRGRPFDVTRQIQAILK